MFNVFISKIEPKLVKAAMEFERNKVWRLVPRPDDISMVGLKWILKNKTDKEGNMVQNKAWQ